MKGQKGIELSISPHHHLKGDLVIPGDKSISHRAIILGSLAEGKTQIKGLLESKDCLKTIQAFKNMGVSIEKDQNSYYLIHGVGLRGLHEPEEVIDCGNSGTTMRLLTGLLAPQMFYSVLTGDNSLCNRPMDRVIKPLTMMGARIWGRKNKYAPLNIKGNDLQGIKYSLPVASAQVKSALLLAGLYGSGKIKLTEPSQSRDHTERMFKWFGVDFKKKDNTIWLPKKQENQFKGRKIIIPGDLSSAAFFIAAGLITKGSEIILRNVGINPTRSGLLDVIKRMGGQLELLNPHELNGEARADILVRNSPLKAIVIEGNLVPRLIDELPIITLLASQAEGKTIIKDAAELRLKETDRIKAIMNEFTKMGVKMEELTNGLIIKGPVRLKGGVKLNSYGDHRIAMSLAIAGLLTDDKIIIKNSQCINNSFPQFFSLLNSLC